MANTKRFEDLVKELEVNKLAQTKQHEFVENIKVIEHIEDVENNKIAEIKEEKTKTINKIIQPVNLIILFFIIFVVYFFIPQSQVKDIVVVGNKSIDSQEILNIANIKINDKLPTIHPTLIKSRLEDNEIIKRAYIKKDLVTQKVYIQISEVSGLYYYENNNGIYLVDVENKIQRLNNADVNFPKFVDFFNVKHEYIEDITRELAKVKPSVLSQISEISYAPTKTFLNRFLLKMNDRNYIYMLSNNVAHKLNYYQELRRVIPKDNPVDVFLENADYYKKSNR